MARDSSPPQRGVRIGRRVLCRTPPGGAPQFISLFFRRGACESLPRWGAWAAPPQAVRGLTKERTRRGQGACAQGTPTRGSSARVGFLRRPRRRFCLISPNLLLSEQLNGSQGRLCDLHSAPGPFCSVAPPPAPSSVCPRAHASFQVLVSWPADSGVETSSPSPGLLGTRTCARRPRARVLSRTATSREGCPLGRSLRAFAARPLAHAGSGGAPVGGARTAAGALRVRRRAPPSVRCCWGRPGEGRWGQGLCARSRRPQRLSCSRDVGTVTAASLPVAPTPTQPTAQGAGGPGSSTTQLSRWQHAPCVSPVPFKKVRWLLTFCSPVHAGPAAVA